MVFKEPSELGSIFHRRDHGLLRMVFGTYEGLATGVDLKTMDAHVSHLDSPYICGWLAIQAAGRLERNDGTTLKRKAYALSSVQRATLPAELSELNPGTRHPSLSEAEGNETRAC